MRAQVFGTISVRNIFCFDKYFVNYARKANTSSCKTCYLPYFLKKIKWLDSFS